MPCAERSGLGGQRRKSRLRIGVDAGVGRGDAAGCTERWDSGGGRSASIRALRPASATTAELQWLCGFPARKRPANAPDGAGRSRFGRRRW